MNFHSFYKKYGIFHSVLLNLKHESSMSSMWCEINGIEVKFSEKIEIRSFQGDGEDSLAALGTLFFVSAAMARLFAPFVPFFTEFLFQRLKPRLRFPAAASEEDTRSVHFLLLPKVQYVVFLFFFSKFPIFFFSKIFRRDASLLKNFSC